MEIKVRAIGEVEQKSVAQVEQELLEKHEREQQAADAAAQAAAEAAASQNEPPAGDDTKPKGGEGDEPELTEEQVLSYIGKRYNKQINSFDDLVAERKESEALPEDVAAYMKYKKETGRGFDDFLKLRKDFDAMNPEQLLKEYLAATQNGLDDEDIDILMEEYTYNEDLDDDSKIKRTKIARKKAIAEAKDFFNKQKEQYKLPLESSGSGLAPEEKEEFDAYRQYTKQAKTLQEENERKRQWFDQKSDEVFSKDFSGFEFELNEKKFTFSPGAAAELRKAQSTPMNFVAKYLDESGLIKDAKGYHKALSIAMNPDKFAKFFYEQGLADATEDVMRQTKNINMSERRAPEAMSKGGMQVKAVNQDNGRSLKIRSIKKI
jgi:hypothetical protein